MLELQLDRIVHHLMVEQKCNMLDKTKCSTSARNIYNFLCGVTTMHMQPNNNLCDLEPNLHELRNWLAERGHAIYYVHLDHLTNETSHYFVICQLGDMITVLQSAVFEFSISDWLHPNESLQNANDEIVMLREQLSGSTDMRDEFLLEQHNRSHTRTAKILRNIVDCRFSQGASMRVDEFMDAFVGRMVEIEGPWTP